MKILIVGSDKNAVLLAQYLKLQDSIHDIYITTEEECVDKYYTALNIKENDISSVCDFVKYNQIEFTIVTSPLAIINGISDIFKKENFPIFAPFAEAARVTYFNSIAKKIMYKLKISTPRFGIFDRENLALDYIRNAKFPIVISNDFTLLERKSEIFPCFSKARIGIQKAFENAENEKVVIEHYIDIEPVYIYFLTDGYSALPLIALERTKGDKYTITTAPSQKVSDDMLVNILKKAIYPLLDDISKFAGGYTGIIGLKVKIQKENFGVLEFYNGFQEYDFQALLSILDDNLLNLLYDASNECLADNHDYVRLSDSYSYSVSLNKNDVEINEDSDEDFIESEDSENIIFTNTSSTMNYAKEELLEYLELICKEEIYKDMINSEKKKECKI